jgi:hypothetical protein
MYLDRNYTLDIAKHPDVTHLRLVVASSPLSGVMMGGKHGVKYRDFDGVRLKGTNQMDYLHLGYV